VSNHNERIFQMYKRDCIAIAEHAAASPEGLIDVIEFTLCTIQAGLSTVKNQRLDIRDNGLRSKYLWGKKSDGMAYVQTNIGFLWPKLMQLKERACCGFEEFEYLEKYLDNGTSLGDADVITEGIMLLMKVPNLGMVKAAFVMQMLGFDVACIDSHNLTRLGMSANAVKIGAKLKTETKYKKIRDYVLMTQERGTEFWWNTWCEYVAGNRANKLLDTGDVVSRFHVECVMELK